MSSPRRLTPFAGTRLAFGSVQATYSAFNATSVPGRSINMIITNSLDKEVQLSFDGTTDFIWLPAGVGLNIDLATNDADFSGTVYLKYSSAAPTAGAIAIGFLRVL